MIYSILEQGGLTMLEQEEAFYQAHKPEIIAQYAGKELIIDGDRIIGSYNTPHEAYLAGCEALHKEQFMIKRVPKSINEKPKRLSPFVRIPVHA
jgi:hypothetical protein